MGSADDLFPDSKVHVTNMGPTWVLLAPDGPHVGPMNLAVPFSCLEYGYLLQRAWLLFILKTEQVNFELYFKKKYLFSYVLWQDIL